LKSRLGACGRACPSGHAVCQRRLEQRKSGSSLLAIVPERLSSSRLQPTLAISPGIHSGAAGRLLRAYPRCVRSFGKGLQRAIASFQLNLTIAVRSRARSRAIEIAAGGLRPGVPLRARGVSASIGTAQERIKPACHCARTSLIQSASADFGYQPWNSFRGGRAVAPGRRTVCQIHVEKGNSALKRALQTKCASLSRSASHRVRPLSYRTYAVG